MNGLSLVLMMASCIWASPAADAGGHAGFLERIGAAASHLGGIVPALPDAPVSVVSGTSRAAAMSAVASGFDFGSLFERGALVADVWGPTDRFSRRISMKLYTVKDGEDLLEKLGIFDITNPSDTFGQEFNIGSALDTTFPLDDRSSGRLWYKHVLRIFFSGRDTWINFGRPGHEDQLSTTVRNLFRLRARQALDEGAPIVINGRRFIVLGQGGPKGSLLFFPDDLESRMDAEDQFQMAPVLTAEVSVRGQDGRNQRIADRVPLGWVGNRYYYLNFDYASESWIPSE